MPESIMDTVEAFQKANLDPQVIRTSGAGKAYQSVAQSTAIAIQDATDALRNLSTISTTAIGVAMTHMLADPSNAAQYEKIISQAQDVMAKAVEHFKTVGLEADTVLKHFPISETP